MKTHHAHSTQKRAAFSLIETLVATGVIATALTGSLGMMAVGLGQSQDSIERARAAMLAQQIVADLRAASPSEAPAPQDNRYTKGIMPLSGASFDGTSLVFDASFQLLETSNTGANGFAEGVAETEAAYVVTVIGSSDPARLVEVPVDAIDRAKNVAADHAPLGDRSYEMDAAAESRVNNATPQIDISRTVITVESPAAAPRSARRSYRYEFLRQ
jgi:Tfp pilus assembly protein PilV